VTVGAGPLIFAGSDFTFSNPLPAASNPFSLPAAAQIMMANGNHTTINSIVTGAATSFTLLGTAVTSDSTTYTPGGILELTAPATFTGLTTINGGTLKLSRLGSIQSANTLTNATNSLANAPTGGTFTLSFNGQTTAPIPFIPNPGVNANGIV